MCRHLKTAIELDPAFAGAFSALALAQTRELSNGLGKDDLEVLEEAERLVEQALAIDDSIPQVYFAERSATTPWVSVASRSTSRLATAPRFPTPPDLLLLARYRLRPRSSVP
jgi:hypothetical protein